MTNFIIVLFVDGDRCLTFKYHMYGHTIDSLRVLQETDTNTIELFSKYGQQSNSDTNWKTASIDIYHNTNDLVSMSRKVKWNITLVNNSKFYFEL